MDATSSRWQAITDSEFPWERDALAFVRDRLPDHDPYRVWSNFEFIADDGSINEVDLLVLTPKGFYLVEIKSRPGIVEGAVRLHQMAAGSLPRWGDGQSEPAVLECEATIDADAFEPAVREGMTAFFRQALRRDYRERFDNAEEMLRAWRQLFLAAARPETDTDHAGATTTPARRPDVGRPGVRPLRSRVAMVG